MNEKFPVSFLRQNEELTSGKDDVGFQFLQFLEKLRVDFSHLLLLLTFIRVFSLQLVTRC